MISSGGCLTINPCVDGEVCCFNDFFRANLVTGCLSVDNLRQILAAWVGLVCIMFSETCQEPNKLLPRILLGFLEHKVHLPHSSLLHVIAVEVSKQVII